MNIQTFIEERKKEIQFLESFKSFWEEQSKNQKEPYVFPDQLGYGDWCEQFDVFLDQNRN